MILLLAAGNAALAEGTPGTHGVLSEFSTAIQELCASVSPAVVQIEVRSRTPVKGDDPHRTAYYAKQWNSGSGVILDSSGYILTNNHVIESAREMDVSVMDSKGSDSGHRHYMARLIGADKETDLAVIKIDAANLPTLQFRNSDTLKQGEIVFALGSPLGLENTLTVGYVSATSRHLTPGDSVSYIQTDAPINPGNSGGPLLDIDGKIAGINTLIASQSGGNEGIGFAIPANVAQFVYRQLRENGRIRRGTIGVVAQDINPILSKALGVDHHPGVILSDIVPHGAAEAAGLQPNDIVVAVNGKPVNEAAQMQAEIQRQPIGTAVALEILRGSEMVHANVAILEQPVAPLTLADLVNGQSSLIRELGLLAVTLDEKVIPVITETRHMYGVVVAAIPAEFAAFNPGLKPGDVIYQVNSTRVQSIEDLQRALRKFNTGDAIALLTERDGTLGYVSFNLE